MELHYIKWMEIYYVMLKNFYIDRIMLHEQNYIMLVQLCYQKEIKRITLHYIKRIMFN